MREADVEVLAQGAPLGLPDGPFLRGDKGARGAKVSSNEVYMQAAACCGESEAFAHRDFPRDAHPVDQRHVEDDGHRILRASVR